ncbi:MAG: hypothetical protein V4508_02455 [Pseudomonadota bacterium]
MKLQIKDAGAWRNIAGFTRVDEKAVLAAAADLLRSLQQPHTVLRVAEGDTPLFWCRAPDFLWTAA